MRRASPRRAFTLIELLVVIAIIAIIIAIVFPALAGARSTVRASSTKQLLANIQNAASAFQTDNNRLPGYFSARHMANAENDARATNPPQGLSAMENIMLDLAGGIVSTDGTSTPPSGGPTAVSVGPYSAANRRIWVAPDLIGTSTAGDKAYYVPDRKLFVAQFSPGQQNGLPGATGPEGTAQLPDIVDHFGNPVLAWAVDQGSAQPVRTTADFAAVNSSGAVNSRYYWAPNSCFLTATALGKKAIDQTDAVSGSLLSGSGPAADLANSMIGFLGNPSYPYRAPAATTGPILPEAGRAPLVLHSAGVDGVYLGRKDRGAKQFDFSVRNWIDYQLNFVKRPNGIEPVGATVNDGYLDKDGKPTNIDILERFDDITNAGGS
ncbi:MAG: prepilin-type N-terminal cleavage/methylation domain-containing protein [Phycisphaerae bacterium]|nr:prepilin-type N-terminal cleavage/methylation domain-containing protein [Phycisphaerae bacterium]